MMKEFHGSEVGLKRNSPLTGRDDGRTGKPEMQMVGSKCDMSQAPVNDFRSEVKEGTRQDIGEHVPLGRTPVKGWDSADTPMSTRANKQQGNGK